MMAEEREAAKKELDKWRQDFLAAALGREPGSCISQLLNKHKIIYDKVSAGATRGCRANALHARSLLRPSCC